MTAFDSFDSRAASALTPTGLGGIEARISERDFVVHVAAPAPADRRRHGRLSCAPRRCARGAEVGAALLGGKVAAASAAGAVEHLQRGIEALQHDLGRVAILAVLVLPFACLQSAF